MTSTTTTPAAFAIKWSLIISGSFILAPVVIRLASGEDISGNLFAQKLVVGVVWIPILFVIFWIWKKFSSKNAPLESSALPPNVPTTATATAEHVANLEKAASSEISKWNYIGVGVGALFLAFLFLPKLLSGEMENKYFLGAAFWVAIIIYSLINISSSRK